MSSNSSTGKVMSGFFAERRRQCKTAERRRDVKAHESIGLPNGCNTPRVGTDSPKTKSPGGAAAVKTSLLVETEEKRREGIAG
jgi:hypothetical protein